MPDVRVRARKRELRTFFKKPERCASQGEFLLQSLPLTSILISHDQLPFVLVTQLVEQR